MNTEELYIWRYGIDKLPKGLLEFGKSDVCDTCIQYYSFLNYSLPLLNQFFNSTILPRFFIFGKKISTLFIRVLITL